MGCGSATETLHVPATRSVRYALAAAHTNSVCASFAP
jgi:hypothetical protein